MQDVVPVVRTLSYVRPKYDAILPRVLGAGNPTVDAVRSTGSTLSYVRPTYDAILPRVLGASRVDAMAGSTP